MAEITAGAVNEFRKKTGLGLMECKALLKEAGGDMVKAETLAKEKGLKQAELRAGRAAKAGRVEVYIHHDAKSGVLIELNCETDFVARNDEFKQLAKDLALHIMAVNPLFIRREDVPEQTIEEQKRIYMSQVSEKPVQPCWRKSRRASSMPGSARVCCSTRSLGRTRPRPSAT